MKLCTSCCLNLSAGCTRVRYPIQLLHNRPPITFNGIFFPAMSLAFHTCCRRLPQPHVQHNHLARTPTKGPNYCKSTTLRAFLLTISLRSPQLKSFCVCAHKLPENTNCKQKQHPTSYENNCEDPGCCFACNFAQKVRRDSTF